jgi:hypothetical protein
MSEIELARICHWVKKGAKLLVGSDHMGHRRIKIVRGPFGLLTKRYKCDYKDIVKLRAKLGSSVSV